MTDLITLEDVEAVIAAIAEADGLLTREEYSEMREWQVEHEAEKQAEGAWLRHAENLGWEESYIEEMIEAGLRSRW